MKPVCQQSPQPTPAAARGHADRSGVPCVFLASSRSAAASFLTGSFPPHRTGRQLARGELVAGSVLGPVAKLPAAERRGQALPGLWSPRSCRCAEPSARVAGGPRSAGGRALRGSGTRGGRGSPPSSPGDGDAGRGTSWVYGRHVGTLQEPGRYRALGERAVSLVLVFRRNGFGSFSN